MNLRVVSLSNNPALIQNLLIFFRSTLSFIQKKFAETISTRTRCVGVGCSFCNCAYSLLIRFIFDWDFFLASWALINLSVNQLSRICCGHAPTVVNGTSAVILPPPSVLLLQQYLVALYECI